MNNLTGEQVSRVLDMLDVDSVEGLTKHYLAWRYFEVREHYIILAVDKREEVNFYINDSVVWENIGSLTGAVILRRLLKEWNSIMEELLEVDRDIEPTCEPYLDDGYGAYRVKMFERVGFKRRGLKKMYFPNPEVVAREEAEKAAREQMEEERERDERRLRTRGYSDD